MSFEKEQRRLNALWQEIMSDEEEADPFQNDASSDEYQLSCSEESDDSDISLPPRKKTRQTNKINVDPCTSHGGPTTQIDTISDTIENVIRSLPPIDSDEEVNDVSERGQNGDINWVPATGQFLKPIYFTENTSGFIPEMYDNYEKAPYEFYKMFVTDDIIELIVSIYYFLLLFALYCTMVCL